MNDDKHIDNVYAFNEDFKEIYIGEVPYEERGIRKNYFCLGCKRKMQAVIGQTKRKKFFRHHVLKNKSEKKCTYNDETFRHKLAKDIIQSLKRIKVPPVYKFDPTKNSNTALLIKESCFVEASKVLIERYIYENENGEIEIYNEEDQAKNLLVKPDAIFLNHEDKPILIIEFVATHKPNFEKLIKLKRLGIDTIQVSVPKTSPEEIQDLFTNVKHTKWLYNNEESKTDYLQFSNEYSGAIFEVDLEQRKLFEEGYKCRSAEIGELILTIKRLLETEHYKGTEHHLRSEIQRVENNTKSAREELDNICEGYIREGIEEHRARREKLKQLEEEFSIYTSNLEERYTRKRSELEIATNKVEQSIAGIEFSIEKSYGAGSATGTDILQAEEASTEIRQKLERLATRKRTEEEIERQVFEQIKREIESNINRIKNSISTLQATTMREAEEIEHHFREQENRIDADRIQLLLELENGENSVMRRIAEEHRKLHAFERAILVYKAALAKNDRIKQINGEGT